MILSTNNEIIIVLCVYWLICFANWLQLNKHWFTTGGDRKDEYYHPETICDVKWVIDWLRVILCVMIDNIINTYLCIYYEYKWAKPF